VLKNRYGLHARSAAKIVELIQKHDSQVTFSKEGHKVDGDSIISLLTLDCPPGSRIEVEAKGEDSIALIEAMVELFARNFDEE
jgi:phosphocarrier protein